MGTKVRMQVGKVWLEVDSDNPKHAIESLSEYAEVFGEMACGMCKSEQIKPVHRTAKGYDFYELRCLKCGAQLSFGQTRDGDRLFPKRKDNEGNWMSNNGWFKYQAQPRGDYQEPAQQQMQEVVPEGEIPF